MTEPASTRSGLLRDQARRLVTLGPAQDDHWAALRVGTSVAVPSLALLAAGRPDLLIYVVFGAFTGMYGRAETHPRRLTHQLLAAVMLVGGVAVGVGLSVAQSAHRADLWTLVLVEALFAGVMSLHSSRSQLRPAGPFFGLFALGACASVPLSVSAGTAIGLAAAASVFSMLVGAAGWVRGRPGDGGVRVEAVVRASPAHPSARVRDEARRFVGFRVDAVSYLVAVAVAGGLSVATGIGHPHWAMAAAAVPLAAVGISHRITRGLHRIVGTLAGLVVAGLVLVPWGPVDPLVLGLLVVVLQFPTEYFMTRHYGLALVWFTPLILIMTQLAHPASPVTLLRDRAIETTGGAVVGMLVAVASSWFARRATEER
ncbi:FUSC family protein [Frondihabitans cladoniiphilus]|uniref:FUSC family protein n=1 Tax=Frondihabitans cladoniiphilus TaxID=715785 RepID=A0ABP8VKX1_9MICO